MARVSRAIITDLFETAISRGTIQTAGKTPAEVLQAFTDYVNKVRRAKPPLKTTIDYRAAVLELAAECRVANYPELEAVLLVIWTEHSLNWLISCGAARLKLSDPTIKQIIRDASFSAKLEWLPQLLGFRKIKPEHVASLKVLGEVRNQFIHYKWVYESPDTSPHNTRPTEEVVKHARKSIVYLRNYINSVLVGKAATKIVRANAL